MSTKIYNGWRIEGVDMVDLLKRLKVFREAVHKTLRTHLCKETARRASVTIDMFRLLGRKTPVYSDSKRRSFNIAQPTSSEMMFDTREQIIEDSFNKDTREFYSLECDVTAFPTRYRGEEFTLLLLFDNTVGEMYKPHFKRILGAKPYWYWNNTDPDPDVSESEWEKRGRRWDAALDYGAAAEHGFTFSCVTRYAIPIVGADETFPHIVPVVKRRKKLYALAVEWESDRIARNAFKRRGKRPKAISDVWSEAKRWLKTPAGQRFKKRLWEQAKKRVRRITLADYKAPLGTYAKEEKRD